MQVKNRKHIITIVSIFTFPMLIPLFFLFSSVNNVKKLRSTGEMTVGVVDSVYLINSTDLVEYWFNGSFYVRKNKEKIKFTNSNINANQNLRKGDKVLIYYDKKDPDNYLIDIDSETNAYYKYLFFELFLFFVGAIVIFYQYYQIKIVGKSN